MAGDFLHTVDATEHVKMHFATSVILSEKNTHAEARTCEKWTNGQRTFTVSVLPFHYLNAKRSWKIFFTSTVCWGVFLLD